MWVLVGFLGIFVGFSGFSRGFLWVLVGFLGIFVGFSGFSRDFCGF